MYFYTILCSIVFVVKSYPKNIVKLSTFQIFVAEIENEKQRLEVFNRIKQDTFCNKSALKENLEAETQEEFDTIQTEFCNNWNTETFVKKWDSLGVASTIIDIGGILLMVSIKWSTGIVIYIRSTSTVLLYCTQDID